mmetsp:Transcript_39543/g.38042  ORF Transcript_39543/g.38042 Transcript_39543/m.38042 type:complete len:95 (+) Transcript_39543:1192-1476(+)
MHSELRDLQLKEDFLDFSYSECGRLSEPKQTTIENRFPFDVQVTWVLRKVISHKTGSEYENPFRFSPATALIPSNSSFTFTVKFAPYEPDSYFF